MLDKKINTPELLAIKAAAAKLPPKSRQYMQVAIKLIEIGRILDYLKETAEQLSRINAETDENSRRKAMLELVLPYLPEANRATLQMLITFMEMANYKEADNGGKT